MTLVEYHRLLQRLQVLPAGIQSGMLGRRVAAVDLHFARLPVVAPFVVPTVRAAPNNPVIFTITGAVMYVGG